MLGDVLSYTSYILMLDSVAPRHPPLSLTALQLLVVAVLAALWTAPELVEQLEAISTNLIPIIYLALVTAATTWLPTVAQKWVSAHETAIIYTFEPMFAAAFSFLLLGETLGVRGLVGAALVLAAMVFSQTQSGNANIQTLPDSEEETALSTTGQAVLSEEKDMTPTLEVLASKKLEVVIHSPEEVDEFYQKLEFESVVKKSNHFFLPARQSSIQECYCLKSPASRSGYSSNYYLGADNCDRTSIFCGCKLSC